MMAVSQENNVYIYDDNGAEIHRLDGHRRVTAMEFLPYHWLLGEFTRCVVIFSTPASCDCECQLFRICLG